MADFSDLINDADKLQEKCTFNLRAVEATIGAVANIFSIIGIPGAILGTITAIEGLFEKDQTAQNLTDILDKLQAVLQFEHSEDEVIQMRQVLTILEMARTRLQTLLKLGVDDPLSAPAEAFHDTLNTVNLLGEMEFWTRPFFQEIVFVNGWFGSVRPPVDMSSGGGRGLVFDYRLTLPAYMEAIKIRLEVLALLRKDFPDNFQDEITSMADQLQVYYDKIIDGFIMPRVPHINDIISFGTFPSADLWDSLGRTFGAVDSYEGFGEVKVYPLNDFPNLNNASIPNSDPFGLHQAAIVRDYPAFATRYALGNKDRWLLLYTKTGLGSVWTTIQHLRSLVRERTENVDRLACWSLGEINKLLPPAVIDPDAPPSFFRVTARDTLLRLSKIHSNLPSSPTSGLSWRGVLATVIP